MKGFFILIINTFGCFLMGQSIPPPEWRLSEKLSDEFNSNKLDDKKWWDFNPSWSGRKPAYFDRKNIQVKKGLLSITAKNLDPEKVSIENKARGMDQFSTGIVKSKSRVLYGYFEARCKIMNSNVCNAFWLYDPLDEDKKYIHGDFSEEIDIFEVFGKAGTYWTTIHRYETPYVESVVNKKKTKLENYYKTISPPFKFYDDFHIFGLKWTPEKLEWYLDGELIFERQNDYFHRPLHIVFDAEIMEAWMGLPDPKDLPSTFYIDYLKVWEYPESGAVQN